MTRSAFLRIMLASLTLCLVAPFSSLARPWKSTHSQARRGSVLHVSGMTPDIARPPGKLPPITPVTQFYVEDISGPPDSLPREASSWTLRIAGDIARPQSLDYDDIVKRPSVTRIITLNCIGNPIGGYAIGNAKWTGLPLAQLIEEADPDFLADTMVLKGADGYHDSLPLRAAKHPGALLVHGMNGKPLTRDHGFPLRVLVPGYYGIKQVKWLKEIRIQNGPHKGYWQKLNWTQSGKVKIFSRIDHPQQGQWLEARRTTLRGVAFAGDRGIQYVQVSLDGEKSWSLAKLDKPLSPYSWVFWSYPVTFPRSGRYRIAVRAADQFSGIQRDDHRNPFPAGVSGIHRVDVNVM
ncbi:putative Oxidoreductase, molybdopterin binding [Nitrospina gracilis 3/211]|uniref:Putative Oxidoreductase, molybdopterin binding n=1 Tax=Nitrospina gracilis (strain 3/211) TaxID=1266370 RepID=M1YV63_NITG3|nr:MULTISPECIES: molybdopterin-dependent oxidoreductase [Nitrospina]MCF8722353.1 DMSO/TMAO reductase YedYZ molybdopterin-dependent catalytic subunit [Nitrospina sp. Nb-3]CCQ89194.1 putative Oxidoreductase, molybdopterin binding [Nitrospina gracilis 3/211]